MEEEKREREIQTRNIIRTILYETRLPEKLPPRFFRSEANQIAKYWAQYGYESGFTFTSLMCLCQARPKTDWVLLEEYPDIFRELSSMVNHRFTGSNKFKWDIWLWFRKLIDPEWEESCVVGELCQHDLFSRFGDF